MISNAQPLHSPFKGIQRYATQGSVASTWAFHARSATSLSDPDDEDYFALLPGSWLAYRTPGVLGAGTGHYNYISAYRRTDGVNSPNRFLFVRGWQAGDDSAVWSNRQDREFTYLGDHFGIELPFAKRIFAPNEFLYGSFSAGVLNSQVYSFEWLQSPDPELLAEALKSY